jgi:small subunit ribosomal protein S16
MGSRQAPTYRLVVSEGTLTPSGSFVDNLGTYNPRTEPPSYKIDVGRTEAWIKKGAHPSETVKSLLAKAKRAQA